MTPPPAHAATVAGAARAPPAGNLVCPECGCPSGADRPPANLASRWPRLVPRYALLLTAALVLLPTILFPTTRGNAVGYGGWNLPKWPSPPAAELREIASGTRDGSALAASALAASAEFRQKWNTDSTLCIQAVAPRRWGYWSEDGVGWPVAWWWHMAYPPDGKPGPRNFGGARFDRGELYIPVTDPATGTDHQWYIFPFNFFLSMWCVAVVWLIAYRLLRRTMRPSGRWVVLATIMLVMLKLLAGHREGWGDVSPHYVALERWPDPQCPISGAELSIDAFEAAAGGDPSGRRLAAELLAGTTDPDNPIVRWSLVSISRVWGSSVHRVYGRPWPAVETFEFTNPSPTTGLPNNKSVGWQLGWWRGQKLSWGSTGFTSTGTMLSLSLGAIALYTTLLAGVWWVSCLMARRLSARAVRRRWHAGHCVACGYPVRPPVVAGQFPARLRGLRTPR